MAIETISALTALVIAVSVVMTAVFNARKGTEEVLQNQIKRLDERLKLERDSYEEKIKGLENEIKARDAKIDELEKRVDILSDELQKVTNPKIKGRKK